MKKTEGLAACLEKGEAALTTAPHERRYLTGFASSAGYVLTTVEAAYFLTDFRYIEAARRAIPDMECLCGDRPAEVLKELLQRHGIGRLLVSAEHTSVKQLADWQRAMKGVCTVAADGRYDARMRLLRLVKTPDELEKLIADVVDIHVADRIYDYIAELVEATRNNAYVTLGVSPRGALAVSRAAKANAYLEGRDYVTPDDVCAVFPDVCAHRLVLDAKARLHEYTAEQIITNLLQTVKKPDVREFSAK